MEGSFLALQSDLAESWWKIWGGLDGYTGSVLDKTLTERADQLRDLPDGCRGSSWWRRAMALVDVCMSGEAPPVQVTVLVDAREATGSNA